MFHHPLLFNHFLHKIAILYQIMNQIIPQILLPIEHFLIVVKKLILSKIIILIRLIFRQTFISLLLGQLMSICVFCTGITSNQLVSNKFEAPFCKI